MTQLLVASAPRASRKLVGLLWPAHSAAYFFRGARYARYDLAAGAVGPPQDIAGHWPGLFDHDIDAALPWPDGSVYFFRGDQFLKYDLDARRAFGGSPRPIAGNWPGWSSFQVNSRSLRSSSEYGGCSPGFLNHSCGAVSDLLRLSLPRRKWKLA